MSVNFRSDSFTDLLLFSGMEFSDGELREKLGENYFSINPTRDFTDYKNSYLSHKSGLNWEYDKFLKVVSKHFDQLVDPSTPQLTGELVTRKIIAYTKQEMLAQKKTSSIFQGLFRSEKTSNLRMMYAGTQLAKTIERKSRFIPQVKQCFEICKGFKHKGKRYYKCIPLSDELCGRVKELDEPEFNKFLSEVFFKYVHVCKYSDCKRKLQIMSALRSDQKTLLLEKLMKRDDWYLQLHDMLRIPKIGEEKLFEQHGKLIADIDESLFIKAFNKDIDRIIAFRKEVPKDTFEKLTSYGYKKYFARMLMEKALKIYLKNEDTGQLTRFIKKLEAEDCLPTSGFEVKDNLLALMFSKPLFLEDQEVEQLMKILPTKLYEIQLIEFD